MSSNKQSTPTEYQIKYPNILHFQPTPKRLCSMCTTPYVTASELAHCFSRAPAISCVLNVSPIRLEVDRKDDVVTLRALLRPVPDPASAGAPAAPFSRELFYFLRSMLPIAGRSRSPMTPAAFTALIITVNGCRPLSVPSVAVGNQ